MNEILNSVDFAIFVFSPDDVTIMRGNESPSIRDNVLFELGLFIGKLDRNRVFYIVPDGSDIHIPTDLVGVTPGKYDPNRVDKSYQAATGAACNQIRNQIKKLGLIVPSIEDVVADKSSDGDQRPDSEWISDLFSNKFESAKSKLKKVMSSKKDDDLVMDTVWLAFINFKINEKSGSLELCSLAKKHSDNLGVQTLIPRMFSWEDYNGKAIELINNALKKFPSNSALIALLADCNKIDGDVSKAIDILNSASPSENPEIAIALSNIYEETDDIEKAINLIHVAYETYPNNESLIYKYSYLLQETNRYKEALYLLNALTINYPKNVTYWGYLSNCSLSLELYDKALIACKKAEELSESKEAWILHNIGNIMNNKGFHAEAIQWLEKGLKLEPSSQYAHDRMATALKGKDEEQTKFNNLCKEGRKLIRSFSPENNVNSLTNGSTGPEEAVLIPQ